MSLKENMDVLKEELSSEEKFFENAIRTERFVKRYQKPLMAGISALVLIVAGAIGYQAYSENKIQRSNEAFNLLLKNPADQAAQTALQNNNPQLFDVWKLSQAIAHKDPKQLQSLEHSQAFGVSDIALYESAVLGKDNGALEKYTKQQGAFYKDLAILELAVKAIDEGKIDVAHQQVALISEESPVYAIAQSLNHYGVK